MVENNRAKDIVVACLIVACVGEGETFSLPMNMGDSPSNTSPDGSVILERKVIE